MFVDSSTTVKRGSKSAVAGAASARVRIRPSRGRPPLTL
jgi:hypothetical protein